MNKKLAWFLGAIGFVFFGILLPAKINPDPNAFYTLGIIFALIGVAV